MMTEGYQEVLRLRLQEKLHVSEGTRTTMETVKMRTICFSPLPGLALRLRETLLLGECEERVQEECGGRWWACQGGEHQKGAIPSHSLWWQACEADREETQPGLGWSGAKGRIHSIMGAVEEEEDCLGLVKETAVGMRKGSHLWHFLWLKAEVGEYPNVRLHMEPLQLLPGQHQRPHSEQETETAGRTARDLEEQVWH